MSSPSRGLRVWDSGSVFGEAIFYFHFPVRSGLHSRYKPQLDPTAFHGSLPTLPGQTPLPCRLSVGGCCHSNLGTSQCHLHRLRLCNMEGVHMVHSPCSQRSLYFTLSPQIRKRGPVGFLLASILGCCS